MRRAARKDEVHPAIVAALRDAGATVLILDVSTEGAPDLLVGWLGTNHLLELKSRGGKLRPAQKAWHDLWRGPKVATVMTPREALVAIGVLGPVAAENLEAMRRLVPKRPTPSVRRPTP